MSEERLSLTLDARRTAIVVIDLQNGIVSMPGADRLHSTTDQPMRASGALPSDWSELIPELDRQSADLVVLKRQWGAFYGTDLDLQLRRRGLGTIVICGIATEFGVESTARDAYERGYE